VKTELEIEWGCDEDEEILQAKGYRAAALYIMTISQAMRLNFKL
jgi:hypothetical protein